MTGYERVKRVITGKDYDRQPMYGWVWGNLGGEITEHWGSVAAFEDKYEFDIAHLFGGPYCFKEDVVRTAAPLESEDLTPDLLVDLPIFSDPNNLDYSLHATQYTEFSNAILYDAPQSYTIYDATQTVRLINGIFRSQEENRKIF